MAGLQGAPSLMRLSKKLKMLPGPLSFMTSLQLCQNNRQGRPLYYHQKTLPPYSMVPIMRGNIPRWRECQRTSLGMPKAIFITILLVPPGLVLQANDCVSICKTLNYRPGPRSTGVGVWWSRTPTPAEEKPKKQVTFIIDKEQGSEPHIAHRCDCLPIWGRGHQVIYHSNPYYNRTWVVHCSLTMKKIPNRVPPPPEEPSPTVPAWPSTTQCWLRARGTRSNEPPSEVDPCRNVEDPLYPLVENPDAQWQDDDVLSCPTWEPQWTWRPSAWFIGRQWHSGYPRPNKKQQDVGPLCLQSPEHHLRDYMPAPTSSDFLGKEATGDHGLSKGTVGLCWTVRVPHSSPLWCSMRELQRCMTPLLALNSAMKKFRLPSWAP